jgi:hypothetical protein
MYVHTIAATATSKGEHRETADAVGGGRSAQRRWRRQHVDRFGPGNGRGRALVPVRRLEVIPLQEAQ